MKQMVLRLCRAALRHRGLVTGTLVAVLLVNLLVVGRLQPNGPSGSDLPLAARCQGGGPGCAEQPLIPPPVGGLPHFDAPPAPVFGRLVLVEPAAPAAVDEAPPLALERPPRAAFA
jgi:hypothetical protein